MNARLTLTKVDLIERSLRCFTFGLIGLVPVFGLPFSLLALWASGVVNSSSTPHWNPARQYLIWGTICGAFGSLLSVVVVGLAGTALVNAYLDGHLFAD